VALLVARGPGTRDGGRRGRGRGCFALGLLRGRLPARRAGREIGSGIVCRGGGLGRAADYASGCGLLGDPNGCCLTF
jgi:hypothetical protein